MKKIAVGDLGEFWYGDYKDPFIQLEGAVPGYPRGVLLTDDERRLLCPYCGKTWDHLGGHVNKKHGLTSRQFKDEVGLLQKSSLVSERVRLGLIRSGHSLGKAHFENLRSLRARARKRQPLGRRAVEYQNKTGRCYEQLKAVGQQLVRENGRVTSTMLKRLGISADVVLARFGTWDAYYAATGDVSERRAKGGRGKGYRPSELLNSLRALATDLGRTPSSSDLRRYGMPGIHNYQRHFGSYTNACETAGLVPYYRPATPETDAEFLLAFSATGNYARAAALLHIGAPTALRIMHRYGLSPSSRGMTHAAKQELRNRAAEIARRLEGDVPTQEKAA